MINEIPSFFAGSSFPLLAKNLGFPLGKVFLGKFPDGECKVAILEKKFPKTAFLLQTLATNPQEHLMEALFLLDALKREGVEKVHFVAPYLAYGRQDRKDKRGVPIGSRILADLLEIKGISSLTTFGLHAPQIEGFYRVPVQNLDPTPLFKETIEIKPSLIVAPDIGSIKIAKAFSQHFNVPYAVMDKERSEGLTMALLEEKSTKEALETVLLVDDVSSTGHTLKKAADLLKEKNAGKIYAAVFHFLDREEAYSSLEKSPIEKLWTLGTLPHQIPEKLKERLISIDISLFLKEKLLTLL